MMNTIEEHVLETIGEDIISPDVFTDDSVGMAQIRDSINAAIEDICVITGSYKRKYHIALQANMMFYEISSARDSFAWPKSVWLINQKRRLDQKDFNWLLNYNYRFLYETGSPLRYFLFGNNKIGVHPMPTSDTDMIEIDAVVIPSRYTEGTDRIKLAENYKWACVHYAVSEFWASRGDAKIATVHFSDFLMRVGDQRLYPMSYERTWEHKSDKN